MFLTKASKATLSKTSPFITGSSPTEPYVHVECIIERFKLVKITQTQIHTMYV